MRPFARLYNQLPVDYAGNGGGCCTPAACPPGGVPGPQGPAGTNGTNGTNGINAFTLNTASWTVPAVGDTVPVVVQETGWMAQGQIIFHGTAGFYQVTTITDETDVVLTNLGYTGNAVAGTVISTDNPITPAGIQGPEGAAGGGVTSVALSVIAGLEVTGSPVTTTGTLAITGDPATAENLVLASTDGAPGAPTFRALVANDIAAVNAGAIAGQVSLTNGGTGQNGALAGFNALSPTTTKGDLIVRNASTGNARLAVGTDGQSLLADSTQATGLRWGSPLVSTQRTVLVTPDTMLAADSIIGVNLTTAGASNMTLIAAPANGRVITYKDEKGDANTNNITILAGAGDTIEGASSYVINTAHGYARFYYNSTTKVWNKIGS